MLLRNFSNLIVWLAFSLICCGLCAAQSGSTTTTITGNINDEQGATIPGAMIQARNLETNLTRTTTAGENGAFLITQLPPGSYEITVSAEGFSAKVTRLDMFLGTTALFNSVLKIGATADIIEVVAGNTLDEGKTENSTNIDRNRIDALPINRRNFLDFSLTTPRATGDRTPPQGITISSGLSFNGQNARFNNVTTDGLDNNESTGGSVRASFSQDAVQEFQVVSDSFSAEFGRATGGIVNIVTRGGGNDLHFSLFGLNRNEAIAARDAFSTIKPEFKQYQFGTTLSGPIKKDQAFFFGSFERLSVKQSNIVTISNETIAAARRRGFAADNGPIPFSQGITTLLLRADAKVSQNDTAWLRYNFSGNYSGAIEPFGGLVGRSNSGIQNADENGIAINNTYLDAGKNLVNETRFLFSRRSLDLANVSNDTQIQLFAPEGRIIMGRSSFLPQLRGFDTFQLVDNVSLSRGRQQLKFGIDLKYVNFTAPLFYFGTGLSVFAPLDLTGLTGTPTVLSGLQAFDPSLRTPQQKLTLMALANNLPNIVPGFPRGVPLADLSFPSFFLQGFSDAKTQVTNGRYLSSFVQDDIKVRSNLLVKLGLRYDITRVDFQPDNNGNFSPRIGIAYQPKALPKLSVRAAYGIFFGSPLFAIPFTLKLLDQNQIKILVVPFPFSTLTFGQPGNAFPQSNQLPASVKFIPQLSQTLTYDRNVKNSYTQQASLGLDYAIQNNTIISLNYAFVRGLKFLTTRNINPVVRPIPGDPVNSAIMGRVDANRGDVFEFSSAFDSYYHAFTVLFNRRFSKNIGLLAHYTVSKAIDNFVDFRVDVNQPNDTLKPALERGLSVQDARSRLVISGVWDLNYTKNPFLSGFQLSTIINAESGRPYNLGAGIDLNMSGDFPPSDRPFGIGRNAGITPGFFNVDLRLQRTITLKERYRMQLFLEAFNLFNRVNISDIDGIFLPDAQGNFNLPRQDNGRYIAPPQRFRSAFAPRQFQVGFRFSY